MLVHFVVLRGVEQSQVEFLGLGSSLANQALFLHDVQGGVYVILNFYTFAKQMSLSIIFTNPSFEYIFY